MQAASEARIMTDTLEPLLLDLVEWVGKEPRLYADVLDRWRTSCPRLTVWEEAVDRGYVVRSSDRHGPVVGITPLGRSFLAENGRRA
jgi:hypothetical protein